jgi:phosphomevalonate kinase
MIELSAPGKLMLSGEWSVLEKGVPCIVLAVEQRVFATIEVADELIVALEDFQIIAKVELNGEKVKFDKEDKDLHFTAIAMETTIKYLIESGIDIKPFKLITRSDIISIINEKGEKIKVGFGSSAAAVVAIIGAILYYHDVISLSQQDKELIFKLGIIAHYFGQGKLGSGFDVAASTFGGALAYKRFDPEWLLEEITNKPLLSVVKSEWPGLELSNITLPPNMELMVGFTGTSASTRKLIREMRLFKQNTPDDYFDIIFSIKNVTEELIQVMREPIDHETILALLDKNRQLLEELSFACSCELEIKAHRVMSQIASKHGAVAKFSGAGGGDCSVGVCFDKDVAKSVISEWQQQSLMPIDIGVSEEGLKREKIV